MAEETEKVRGDQGKREIEQREILDWSGKRVVLPRGTTLPSTGLPGEVFVKENTHPTADDLYIFDSDRNNWVTVGPA